MKLTNKEKREIKEEVGEMLDSCEHVFIASSEKKTAMSGTPIEIVSCVCNIVEHLVSEKVLPEDVIKSALQFACECGKEIAKKDEKKKDIDKDAIDKMFDDLLKEED